MEKTEKRPGYFARLKKKRQQKQSQSEKADDEQNQSDLESKTPIICEPAPIGQSQERNAEREQPEKTKSGQNDRSDDNSKSCSQTKKEKSKPPGTVEYTVGLKDTLNSIALKFNITPNKLVHLNRLFSHSVLPGQKLFVPDVDQSEGGSQVNGSSEHLTASEKDGESSSRSGRPVRREVSPLSEDESPATVKFIKMSCKYFTDGMGVVGGVMIITPNNIMFDPHKSDPLVIENGCEEYGLICPMEEVLSVALYDDVSRMKLKDALPSDEPRDLCPLYRPGEWEELPSERDLNPFSRYEALGAPNRPIILDDIETAVSEISECQIADKSPSDEGFTELELLQSDSNTTCSGQEGASLQEHRKTPTRMSMDQKDKSMRSFHAEEDEDEGLHNRSTDDNTELLQSLPALVHDGKVAAIEEDEVTKTRGETIVNGVSAIEVNANDQKWKVTPEDSGKCSPPGPNVEGPNSDVELSEAEKRRRASEAEMKSWLLKRMQRPIEDMLLFNEEKSKAPPMFLCFKVGKPMRKSFATGRTSSPAHSLIGRGRQPEYWFAVPQERVDHLYSFFIQWSPDAYGKDAQEQGFVVVEKDELTMIDNFFSDPVPRSWEIITINEAKRRQSFSFEDEEPLDLLPVLMDPSALLEDTHIEKLSTRLPARVQGYPWRLVYSTVVHGTSLKTLYRNLMELDCPVLMVIKDMDNQIFGAFSTHPFRVSEHCYGTGETFLYSFCPEIKVYRWTGENSYFVKGNTDSLQIGGGGGRLGLWLDADLYHGTTSKCSTFNNLPLSSKQDFTIQNLEVWAFE
ncbi:nuclear receptor coactivator 7-like isoform X1 [Ctenopharyngodon idella]|uniref:nuclear receptor coactivator 7-like isoform X1 n=1 Tax=Ctenopharyngodon idella TaxID=7959 RepID=UPI002230A1E5|nr:nuclear receptor coactivator 7-like isoform X1 [Ctenopharyngodon idella]XP_051731328.1 nuclear receptor coactivator 7-like isoform X1 [Ctenopharyngodon idella]XP_051731329.1 nuclear receptor coactivator 7-like isoform X1 [Ctenopharyngodon idella]